jgi:hypothetical protein
MQQLKRICDPLLANWDYPKLLKAKQSDYEIPAEYWRDPGLQYSVLGGVMKPEKLEQQETKVAPNSTANVVHIEPKPLLPSQADLGPPQGFRAQREQFLKQQADLRATQLQLRAEGPDQSGLPKKIDPLVMLKSYFDAKK